MPMAQQHLASARPLPPRPIVVNESFCWASAAARVSRQLGREKVGGRKALALAEELCCAQASRPLCSIEAGHCQPAELVPLSSVCWPPGSRGGRGAAWTRAACCRGERAALRRAARIVPPWMREEVSRDFQPWRGKVVAGSRLHEVERDYGDRLCRFTVVDGRLRIGRTAACEFQAYGPPVVRDVAYAVDALLGAGLLRHDVDFFVSKNDFEVDLPPDVPAFVQGAVKCQRGVILVPLNDCLGGLVDYYVGHGLRETSWESASGHSISWVGCFRDDHDREFGVGPLAFGYNTTACAAVCWNLGKPYMALQAGGWCGCGDAYASAPQYVELEDDECRSSCTGEKHIAPQRYCGGLWSNAVYRINAATTGELQRRIQTPPDSLRSRPRTKLRANTVRNIDRRLVWRGRVRFSTRCTGSVSGSCRCEKHGGDGDHKEVQESARYKLLELARRHPLAIAAEGSCAPGLADKLPACLASDKHFRPSFDWGRFMFHASVDATAYNTLANWRPLLLGRVLLKQASDINVAWFRRGLRPFLHYFPMHENLSNALKAIFRARAARGSTERLRRRAMRFGQRFVRNCQLFARVHLLELLRQYAGEWPQGNQKSGHVEIQWLDFSSRRIPEYPNCRWRRLRSVLHVNWARLPSA